MKKIFFLITMAAAVSLSALAAFEDRPAARPAGLAGTYTALGGDAASVLYNPAGLSSVKYPEISLAYAREFLGIDYDGLNNGLGLAVVPVGNICTLGAGYLYFSSDLYRETTLSFALAVNLDFLGLPVSAGAAIRSFEITYGENDYTRMDGLFAAKGMSLSTSGVDLGCTVRFSREFTAGAVIENFVRPDISLAGDLSAVMPRVVKAGLAYASKNIIPALDIVYRSGRFEMSAGMEYTDDSGEFVLRGGGSSRELAFGASYILGEIKLDYAFSYPVNSVSAILGSHLISMDWRFGYGKKAGLPKIARKF